MLKSQWLKIIFSAYKVIVITDSVSTVYTFGKTKREKEKDKEGIFYSI